MKLYVQDWAKGKTVLVGNIIGDTLHKVVNNRKHFMRNQGGYGISEEGLGEAKKRGVKTIRIFEQDTGQTFEVSLSDWMQEGTRANYGHGQQVFLPLKFYRLVASEEQQSLDYTEDGMKKMHEAMKKLFGKKDKQLLL